MCEREIYDLINISLPHTVVNPMNIAVETTKLNPVPGS